MNRDPLVMVYLGICVVAGTSLLFADYRRFREGSHRGRPARFEFEVLFHICCLLGGVVGIISFNWAIVVFAVLSFVFAVSAYRFLPGEGVDDTADGASASEESLLKNRADLPTRFDDGQL